MFPVEVKKGKKSRKSVSTTEETDEPEPIDVLVDTILGFLEKGTAYMRAVANHVFTILTGSVKESTVDLIVAVRHNFFRMFGLDKFPKANSDINLWQLAIGA